MPPILILALPLTALILRLHALDAQSLWYDELASALFAKARSFSEVRAINASTAHPLGYDTLLYFWFKIFSLEPNELSLRFPSAIAGTLSVPALYLLGKRFFNQATGLIAATLVAILYAPIYFSQETRSYSFLLLFTILSWIGWNRSVYERKHLFFILTAGILAQIHYFGLALVGFQLLAWNLFANRTGQAWSIRFRVSAGVVLLSLPSVFGALHSFGKKGGWIQIPTADFPIQYLRWVFNSYFILGFVAFVLIAIQLARAFKTWRRSPPEALNTLLVLAWFFLPIVAVMIFSWIYSPVGDFRYLFIVFPAALLLVANFFAPFLQKHSRQVLVVFIILAWGVADLTFVKNYYGKVTKEEVREAVRLVATRPVSPPGKTVFISNYSDAMLRPYLDMVGSELKVDYAVDIAHYTTQNQDKFAALSQFLQKRAPKWIWYMVLTDLVPNSLELQAFGSYELQYEQNFYKIHVALYRAR